MYLDQSLKMHISVATKQRKEKYYEKTKLLKMWVRLGLCIFFSKYFLSLFIFYHKAHQWLLFENPYEYVIVVISDSRKKIISKVISKQVFSNYLHYLYNIKPKYVISISDFCHIKYYFLYCKETKITTSNCLNYFTIWWAKI